jgi:hypothetical protein
MRLRRSRHEYRMLTAHHRAPMPTRWRQPKTFKEEHAFRSHANIVSFVAGSGGAKNLPAHNREVARRPAALVRPGKILSAKNR